jgi:hypothetical protein
MKKLTKIKCFEYHFSHIILRKMLITIAKMLITFDIQCVILKYNDYFW